MIFHKQIFYFDMSYLNYNILKQIYLYQLQIENNASFVEKKTFFFFFLEYKSTNSQHIC